MLARLRNLLLRPDTRDDPIILTGRGGSGTRLLSEIASECDIFLGNELNVSMDSVEWIDPVYPIATSALANSNRPTPRDQDITALRRNAALMLKRADHPDNQFWGWKLPETMLILPEVLAAFPRARLVHLVRHPVTSSLRRTHLSSRFDNPIGKAVVPAAYIAANRDPSLAKADPDYLRNAITWLFQVRTAIRFGTAMGNSNYLMLRYEDICAHPQDVLSQMQGFLGKPSTLTSLVAIDPARSEPAKTNEAQAAEVWDLCGPIATELGYGPEA